MGYSFPGADPEVTAAMGGRATTRMASQLAANGVTNLVSDSTTPYPLLLRGGLSLGLRAARLGFGFLTAVLLGRLLGAEGYGVYAYAFTIMSLLATPAQAGLPTLVVREVAAGSAKGELGVVRGLLVRANQAVLLFSAIVALLSYGALQLVNGADPALVGTFAWSLALLPLIALGNLRGAALRGFGRVIEGQLPEILIRPGVFIAVLVVAWATTSSVSPARAMMWHFAAALVAFMVGSWLLMRGTPTPVWTARSTYEYRAWLRSLLPLSILGATQAVNHHADLLLLGVYATAADVGVYRAATLTATLVSIPLTTLTLVLAPRLASTHALQQRPELQHAVTSGANIALACALPVALLLLAGGKHVLELAFGPEFGAGHGPLAILVLAQLVNVFLGPVALLMNMTRHEKDTLTSFAVAATINIAAGLVLIPQLGAYGAALAASTGMITWNLLLWRKARLRLGIATQASRS
jgi:O-antigen/teichoic acid export membrane protein